MSDLYFCPTVGEIESASGSGFKGGTCCAHPELHAYLGYSNPGIEALSQYLSDKARKEYAGPPTHPGQEDPTTIKWVSNADEAKAELLRLQKVARYYRDGGDCPGYETEPNTCRCGCEGCAHNCAAHTGIDPEDGLPAPCKTCGQPWHKGHQCTALEAVTKAIARHDLVNLVGLEPHQDLPDPDHHFWTLWRATAEVALTAYSSYIEHLAHAYLSTGCRHGEHGYCQSNTGSQGQKTPAVCKFCEAPCVCPCHIDTPAATEEKLP